MPGERPGIGLMMIVKDEAHVVATCLESARALVDWWVVVDTGSSDGTQDLVRSVMDGVPGELVERPWLDFGHNRGEALDLARRSPHRGAGDYAVWIDADEHFRGVPDDLGPLDQDGYFLTVEYGGTRYARIQLVRLDSDWVWRDPLHEYLHLPEARLGSLDAPTIWQEHTGARALDPDTYRKDAGILEAALAEDPDSSRLQFYVAQSLRDAGELERAVTAYRARAAHPGGWDQERWYAQFQLAVVRERLGHPPAEVADDYLAAFQACAWRAEPLVELSRLERARERYAVALVYARTASTLPMPGTEGLFVDTHTYAWRVWDELALGCYWTGRYAEGLAAAQKALAARPDDERLRDNVVWCERALRGE